MIKLKKKTDSSQIKNIDLCQALKGTVFKTQLNKLWDIKSIIDNVKAGFASLRWDHCDKHARNACEGNQETPYKLYCKSHFKVFGTHYQNSIYLKQDLRYNTMILCELEGYLIRLQERIDYFNIENDKKDPKSYKKVKGLIEDNFGELKNLLESLSSKCMRINQLITKTTISNSKMKYEYLTFIKDDYDKCKNTIFMILSMIPEIWDKIETDSLVRVIVDSYEGVPLDEEAKESIPSLVPDYIYGKEYQLVHIPTQSLVQFRELEDKIWIERWISI